MKFRTTPFCVTLSIAALNVLVASAQVTSIDWRSEGTFDASGLPTGTAFNTFIGSSIDGIELVDVNFSHTIDARADGSLRLFDGTFTISDAVGDQLHGAYQDFIYAPNDPDPGFTGLGNFDFTGGTGRFQGAIGSGSWIADAGFTSATGGFANHDWTGSLTLVPEPATWGLLLVACGSFALYRRPIRA